MSTISELRNFLRRESLLAARRRELSAARAELAKLRTQNERMRAAMRRCLSCEYRLEVIGRSADVDEKPEGDSDIGVG